MRGTDNENRPQAPKGARLAFGVFMVLIYLAVGLLFIFKIFDVINPVISYIVGGLLIVFVIFRGYRLYKGY